MARTKQTRREISRPPLHDACARGNVEEVLALLQQEGRQQHHHHDQVNMRDASNDGTTPLHVAVMYGRVEVARLLLNQGANINSKDNFGRTPIALANNHSDIIQLLTEHGAKPEGAQLLEACCQHKVCDLSVIQALVKDVDDIPAFINYQDSSGYTALHYVCERGDFDVARFLLQKRADWTITNMRGQTPLESLQRKLLMLGAADDKIQSANQAIELLDLVEKKDALYEQLVKHVEEGDFTSATHLLETQGALPDAVFLKHSDDPKMTPLMHAVSTNNTAFAKFLLKYRANVNSHGRCFRHEPPLIMAIQKNYFEMFDLLLGPDGGADPNVEGCYGCRTPLHIACRQGMFAMAKRLIEKGANVHAKTDDSNGGSTPLHWAARCRTSPEDGNAKPKLIKLLLDHHADPNALDFDGDQTALHMIASCGRCITPEDQENNDQDDYVTCEAMVHSLIEAGADLDMRDDLGNTPLNIAMKRKNFNFAKALLRHNCDVNLLSSTDDASNLHVACGCLNDEMRTLDLIKVMIEERHCKIHNNLPSTCLHYPLHQAAYAGNYHIVKYLLSKGANIFATNADGETCIDMAREEHHDDNFLQDKSSLLQVLERTTELVRSCQSGNIDQIRNALTSAEEDIFAQVTIPNDGEGDFLIHQVVRHGLLDTARHLINRGADLNTKRDKDGKTPLDIAMDYGHSDIVSWIKNYNTTSCTNASPSEVKDNANQLFEDIEQGDCNINKIQQLLEDGGLNANARDKYSSSRTLLHAAALYGEEDVVRLLLQHGADVNLCNTWGHSPLHASARGSFAVTKLLLTCDGQDIDVDKTDDFDNTPLHIASRLRHVKSAKILLANGANLLARNIHGLTPVDLARHRDYHGEGLAWSHTLLLVQAAQKEDVDQIEKILSSKEVFVQVQIPDEDESKKSLTWDDFIAKTVKFVNACLLGDFDEVEKYHRVDIFAMEEHPETSGEFLFPYICHLGLLEVAKDLYQRGANPNSTRDDGRTALSLAAKQGDIDMVRWLLCDVGVNFSTTDIWGNTPLHLACREGNTEIVSFMVANCSKKEGFDIIAKNWLGQTAKDVALKHHQHDIISLFDAVLIV